MATLVWDQVGARTYQTGVDRGVLYLPDKAVVWNGLTSIEERFDAERKTFYLDGVKFLEHVLPSDFSAQLKAFTYPEEFERILGVISDGGGMQFHDQRPARFGLSYRTLLGDDISGTARGYRVHMLYNLTAIPDAAPFSSLNAGSSPIEFSWNLSGTPVKISGVRPTVHISFDSTEMDSTLLSLLEAMLYGDVNTNPRLPLISEILEFIGDWGILITDNGDGTWTASGPDNFVSMTDSTTFQITEDTAIYLDADTYQVSSTQF